MADVMQFVRELFEGHPPGTAVRAVVTHAVRIFTDDPSDPWIYEIQVEIGGYTYATVAFARDLSFALGIQMGQEVLLSKPLPGQEGYPIFLRIDPIAPNVLQPHAAPVMQGQNVPLPQPPAPQATQPQPVPPAPVAPAQPAPVMAPPAPPMPPAGSEEDPLDPRQTTQVPFDPNAADEQRSGEQQQ